MHASIACLLLYEDYVWVSLRKAMKAKQRQSKVVSLGNAMKAKQSKAKVKLKAMDSDCESDGVTPT